MFGLFRKKNTDIKSVIDATMIKIDEVNDEVFSNKLLGDGVGFIPSQDTGVVDVVSPCDGTISCLFPTGHAFGIALDCGVELLVHIGIDTVEANGEGFKLGKFAQGDKVSAGDTIVSFDVDKLSKTYDMTIMLTVTETMGKTVAFTGFGSVRKMDTIAVV